MCETGREIAAGALRKRVLRRSWLHSNGAL
jgi:hypothetical protein